MLKRNRRLRCSMASMPQLQTKDNSGLQGSQVLEKVGKFTTRWRRVR